MPWKKKEDGAYGIGKGEIWLWLRKRQFKNGTKTLTIGITKSIKGTGVNKNWQRVGTLYLTKNELESLKYEIENILRTW